MPRGAAPPKISFSNWILGGDLVTPARRRPAPTPPTPPPDAPPAKPTKPTHRHARRSRDYGTDTEKDAARATQKRERAVEAGQTAVPRDEVARRKKEDQAQKNRSASGWTDEQDARLLAMKKAGNSWKMIAQALGASKRGVVGRFKELCELADSKNGGDDDVFALGEMPGMFAEDDDADAAARPSSPPASREGKKGKDKGSAQKAAPEGVRVDASAAADDAAAGRKLLRPDGVWTVHDLEVLAEVEQRYRELKWMYVQAGFYNLTGRMVGAEIVRAKFEEA